MEISAFAIRYHIKTKIATKFIFFLTTTSSPPAVKKSRTMSEKINPTGTSVEDEKKYSVSPVAVAHAPEDLEMQHAQRQEYTLTFTERSHLGDELKKELEKAKKEKDKEKLGKIDIDEHNLPLRAIADRFGCKLSEENPLLSEGLTAERAGLGIETYGLNRLTPPKRTPAWLMLVHEFTNPLTALLLLCALLSYILYALDSSKDMANIYLGSVLVAVTVLNALIDFVQLQKSASILESFKSFVPQATIVIREGKQSKVPAETVTIGDVVLVKEGDKIPADIRVIFAENFKVDNSSLTGESEPQVRKAVLAKKALVLSKQKISHLVGR